MYLLITVAVIATTFASLSATSTTHENGASETHGDDTSEAHGTFESRHYGPPGSGNSLRQTYGGVPAPCGRGKFRNAIGACVEPVLTQNKFFYKSPPLPIVRLPLPEIPPPKIDYNLVYLNAPEKPVDPEPIIVPANEKRTAVVLLNKNQLIKGPQVIEVPSAPQQKPEVFYVNYNEGENVKLPGGVNLHEALLSANAQQGQVIGGGYGGSGQRGGYATRT